VEIGKRRLIVVSIEEYIKIAVLDNEIEAGLLDSILIERDIPHLMRSYHDTAYDGLFQTQKGWGYVGAPESFKEEIMEILDDLRKESNHLDDSDTYPSVKE
jgi:hypothetical protein